MKSGYTHVCVCVYIFCKKFVMVFFFCMNGNMVLIGQLMKCVSWNLDFRLDVEKVKEALKFSGGGRWWQRLPDFHGQVLLL